MMRGQLAVALGIGFMMTACGATTGTTTTTSAAASTAGASTGGVTSSGGATSTGGAATTGAGTSTGSGSTGAATTGGSTSSSTSGTTGTTTSGTTGGGLAAGSVCSANTQCQSDICGITGSGNCCTALCSTTDATCGATACDDTGACTYPTTSCGTASCSGAMLTQSNCDGTGTCAAGAPAACPNSLQCNGAGTACLTICAVMSDCVVGAYCDTATSQCIAQQATGPCTSDSACTSDICGLNGSGNCCTSGCPNSADPSCQPTGCDATSGACLYPVGTACGASCSGSTLNGGTCDATGNCDISALPCPADLVCNDGGTACLTTCATIADCQSGFYCSGGSCLAQAATGPCSTNDACTTGVCGINGSGNCCTTACSTTDATCGATACDGTGACTYPSSATACGLLGCNGAIISSATTCDGMGTCIPNFVDCSPYACSGTTCLTTCSASGGCGPGYLCDTTDSSCCGPGPNGALNVDAKTGDDTVTCCGTGTNTACQTLTHAMVEIDTAQATNVTLNATVSGAGGDWAPSAEVYPVVLGWGVELSAPGVFFLDPNSVPNGPANAEILDVNFYSANDTLGYASIVGSATSPIGVGMNKANNEQTDDVSAISVETGAILYLANANVNGSQGNPEQQECVFVSQGASLWLGADKSATNTGTVTMGNALGNRATNGFRGIVCGSDSVSGCTIQDVAVPGQSSVIIEGQSDQDIDAEDFADISLTGNPVIGVPPTAVGFNKCPQKVDVVAFLANGKVTLTFKNGTVQCIAGNGFELDSSNAGRPTVTIDSTTIQNTDLGVLAKAGTATLTNSTITHNFNGVQQAADVFNGTVDLSGGGNTVICSSNVESSQNFTIPGIDVYNTTTVNLKADNVAWDTTGPDYFQCDSTLTTCVCNIAACTTAAGADDMDAVEDSTNLGGITTTGNTQSPNGCN